MPVPVVCAVVPSAAQLVDALRSEPLTIAEPYDAAALVDALPATPEHVLLVGEERHRVELLRAAAALTDLGRRVAVQLLPHGPAGVTMIARETLLAGADAGQAPVLAAKIAATTWSGAWVPGVAKLVDPQPRFGQHVASLLSSRRGFVVDLAGSGKRTVTRVGGVPSPQSVPRPVLGLTPGSLRPQARKDLVRAAGAHDATTLDWLTTDVRERFGHPGAVEGVAPAANGATTLAALGPATESCRVCGVAVYTPACPYCHVVPSGRPVTVPGGPL